jgi:LmbE family N-acetylglucosaminyl deacetylase
MDEPVLLLSPHCDDGPLSIGAGLLAGVFGPDVEELLVFSRSRYTQFTPGTGEVAATSALRQAEEQRAGDLAGYRVTFLGFPEPFARPGYTAMAEIFDPARPRTGEGVWPEVHATLLARLRAHRGPVIGPLGCGQHIDHRMVTTCLREYMDTTPDAVVLFYEDLPYAARPTLAQIAALVPPAGQGEPLVPVPLPGAPLAAKLRLLTEAYPSQLGEKDLQEVASHWARRGGAEVVWVPARYRAQFTEGTEGP